MKAEDFKKLVSSRLKTAELLMSQGEWSVAAYMLGFVLECVLKAAVCKSLNLQIYPSVGATKNREITNYFLTHNFDMLLVISGTSDIFGLLGAYLGTWSGFTQEFQGPYTSIRYQVNSEYDEVKVKRIHNFLTRYPHGIIPLMNSEKKW